MDDSMLPIIIALIAALPGLGSLIIQYRKDRDQKGKEVAETEKIHAESDKLKVDAANSISDASIALYESYKKAVDELREEVAQFKETTEAQRYRIVTLEQKERELVITLQEREASWDKERNELLVRITQLEEQVRSLGGKPELSRVKKEKKDV